MNYREVAGFIQEGLICGESDTDEVSTCLEVADFSGEKVVKYARVFLENRRETFHKDVERCLMEGCKV